MADWIGDAHKCFSVGDEVLVWIQKVGRESLEDISIWVDIKSISQNTSQDNLLKCRVQSKYMGKGTDVHKGGSLYQTLQWRQCYRPLMLRLPDTRKER